MITLWQAEWCPFSSAVRERLTELGIDFVARQVAPQPELRGEVDEIPTLELEGGTRLVGTEAIFGHLASAEPGRWEREHRERYAEHAEDRRRDAPGTILRRSARL